MRSWPDRRRLPLLLVVLILPFAGIFAGRAGAHADTTPAQTRLIAPAVNTAPPPVEQQSTADSLGLVREAFDLLYGGYIFQLSSDELLADAWDGVNNALVAAGQPRQARPRFTGNPDDDWTAFTAAFRRAASGGAVPAVALAYGANTQMATARNSCHTAFLEPALAAIENGAGAHQPTVDAGFVAGRNNLLVYRVYPGGPADMAGMKPGDTLLSSAGKGNPGIRRRIFTTAADTPIPVVVQRPGVRDPITLTIVPEVTVIPFIRTAILPGNIGVIQWDDFTAGAGQVAAIRQTLTDFEAQGVVGWVLDLRTSPGGDSHTMAAIANLFIGSGKLDTTIDRAGGRQAESADAGAAFPVQRPLVVLTENYSASAADILPGILQDYGRAYLIGETTNGCISSSRIQSLANGSELQVEVQRVLIGKDDLNLDGIGVTPNETIVRTPEALQAGIDPQLDRAASYLTSVVTR